MAKKKAAPNIYIRQFQQGKSPRTSRKGSIVLLIVLIMIAAGIAGYQYRDLWMRNPQQIVTVVQKESLSLYYPAASNRLAEKRVDIKINMSEREKADLILKHLKTLTGLPQALTLYDMAVDSNGIMYLNFSKDIVDLKASAMTDILKTFSVINSFLATLRNANKIQLLADGQPIYTTGGTVYAYKPIEFNRDLLED